MRKQARRLWLGDWHRDQEPESPQAAGPDQDDVVVIKPLEDDEAQAPERRRELHRGAIALMAIAVLFGLGFAVSSGRDDNKSVAEQSQAPPAQTPQAQPQVPQTQVPQVPQGAPPQGFGGPDLTGAGAEKAAEAALSKYPGDIERVTAGPGGGGYVVHVIQADGNEVHVLVDDQFKVQGSDANSRPRNFGSGTSQ